MFCPATRLRILNAIHENSVITHKDMRDYADACFEDLGEISAVAAELGLGKENSSAVQFFINRDDSALSANVFKSKNDTYVLECSVGMFLAIDDFAAFISHFFVPNSPYKAESGLFLPDQARSSEEDRYSRTRYWDYTELVAEIASGQVVRRDLMLSGVDVVHNELTSTIANALVLWIVLHELGHIALGHCDHYFFNHKTFTYDEFEVSALLDRKTDPNFDEEIQGDKETYHYAREFQADYFATIACELFYMNKESVSELEKFGFANRQAVFRLLMSVVSYAPLLLERAAVNGSQTDIHHPSPLARAFNTWVALEAGQQHLLERLHQAESAIDPDTETHFQPIQPEEAIELWSWMFMHFDFISDYLNLQFTEDSPLKNLGKKMLAQNLDNSPEVPLLNMHRLLEANKLCQTLWNYRYTINFFTRFEFFWPFVEQWKRCTQFLIGGMNEKFRLFRPFQELSGTSLMFIRSVDGTLDLIEESSTRGIRDVDQVKKLLVDAITISSVLRTASIDRENVVLLENWNAAYKGSGSPPK